MNGSFFTKATFPEALSDSTVNEVPAPMFTVFGVLRNLFNGAVIQWFSKPRIPVSAEPSSAGRTEGNLASGIVPEVRFDAFRFDKLAPDTAGKTKEN